MSVLIGLIISEDTVHDGDLCFVKRGSWISQPWSELVEMYDAAQTYCFPEIGNSEGVGTAVQHYTSLLPITYPLSNYFGRVALNFRQL